MSTPKEHKIALLGLGYVGLPLAVAFAEHYDVLGFDTNAEKAHRIASGIDPTNELEGDQLSHALTTRLRISSNPSDLSACNTFIITVPTDINPDKSPNLDPLIQASRTIGQHLHPGDLVIYESTTYPGCTEEVCVPILEQTSGLTYNQDFTVGYSPERINPGDKQRNVTNILKVTSGSTKEAAKEVDALYNSIITAGTHLARYLWVGLLLLSNSVYALFEDEGARKKLNDIQDQLNALQSSIEFEIKEKFTNFEKNNKVDPRLINNLSEKINSLFDDLAKLRGEVEVLTYAVQTSEERQKVLYSELNERLQKIEENTQKIESSFKNVEPVQEDVPLTQNNLVIQEEETVLPEIAPEPIPGAADLPPLVDKNIEYQEFEDAKKLITATKYKEAFDAFDKFIINYPASELLPEAKFNLGYTQFALRNYKAAINTFNKIVLDYPDNPIAPNSLYQLSNSQIQLTRITKAKQTLRTLIKKYPNADIIQSAKKRLKDLESIKL